MREFFHGWRRKLGCVMLAFACGLTCLWFRAHVRIDAVYVNEARANLLSEFSGLVFVWSPSGNGDGLMIDLQSWTSNERENPFEGQEIVWRREMLGLQAGTYNTSDPVTLVVIPHLWLIVPLTLASAYLLLRKPRKRLS